MKKTLFVIFSICIWLTALAQSREELEMAIAQMNAQMPYPFGMSGEIQSISCEGQYVVYHISVNDFGAMTKMGITSDKYKESMLLTIPVTPLFEPETYKFYEIMVQHGLGLKYNIVSEHDGNAIQQSISPDEFASAFHSEPNFKKLLEMQVNSANSSYPIVTHGMTITKCTLTEQEMVTTALVDETIASMDLLSQNIDVSKASMMKAIADRLDAMLTMNVFYCCMAGYGYALEYVGSTTGKKVKVVITQQELQSLFSEDSSDN